MKRILVIATGGTIAGVGEAGGQGYRSGQLGVAALLEAVPALADVQVRTHQLANIGSQDMNEALWLKLATLVAAELASADCDGVVVIHGTDTLEETAFFLHCVLPLSDKPVVLTGAMLPATAPAADGPRNLTAALSVATSNAARGHGVQVVFADHIFSAAHIYKADTRELNAFRADAEGGVLGKVNGTQPVYFAAPACAGSPLLPTAMAGSGSLAEPPSGRHADTPTSTSAGRRSLAPPPSGDNSTSALHGATAASRGAGCFSHVLPSLASAGALPPVALLMAHVGQQPDQVAALVGLGYRGIVYAGLGNGNLSAAMLAALVEARQKGIPVVRGSRVAQGGVSPHGEVDDAAHGFIAAGTLGAPKARILLSLALGCGCDLNAVRQCFEPYAVVAEQS